MKKKILIATLLISTSVTMLTGCQSATKSFGGKMTLKL